MSEIRLGFGGSNDRDEQLRAKSSSLVFGLQKATIKSIKLNQQAGKDKAAANAVELVLDINGSEVHNRYYEITKIYDSNNQIVTDVNSDEYIKLYNGKLKQLLGTITHIIKATGVTQAQIDAAFSQNAPTFVDWVNIMLSLIPQSFNPNIDVFLEYQWKITTGKDRTFLQLPSNMKGGYWIAVSIPVGGEWVKKDEIPKVKDGQPVMKDGQPVMKKGLFYVDSVNPNNIHPFQRDANYMESNKAQTQTTTKQANKKTSISSIAANLPQATSASNEAGW